MEHVQLTTADGHVLPGDLLVAGASRDADDVSGAVVLCHPHPRYGGDRMNPVIDALFHRLHADGFHVLRFDFRRDAGGSGAVGGEREHLDVVAAIDLLAERFAGEEIHVVGYSFGAAVGLTVDDRRVSSCVGVAPPLSMMPVAAPGLAALVVVPAHDQFCPPDVAAPIVATWPRARMEVIEMGDHFLTGRSQAVAETVSRWLRNPERVS